MASYKEPFPAAEGDGLESVRQVASKLSADPLVVERVFSKLFPPEWATPANKKNLQAEAEAYMKLQRHLEQAISAYWKLSQADQTDLTVAGMPTVFQLIAFSEFLERDIAQQKRWLGAIDTRGGKNPAADIVAEGVRRIFRRSRWKITYGQVEGAPSTKFCRAVEYALAAFGVVAHWRNPAERAYRYQLDIEGRLARYHLSKSRNTDC